MKPFEPDHGLRAAGARSARLFMPTAIALTMVLNLANVRRVSAEDRPMYLDDTKPIDQRIGDLLPRLSVEEKVANQRLYIGVVYPFVDIGIQGNPPQVQCVPPARKA